MEDKLKRKVNVKSTTGLKKTTKKEECLLAGIKCVP